MDARGIPYDKAIYLMDEDGYIKTQKIEKRYYPTLATLENGSRSLLPFGGGEMRAGEERGGGGAGRRAQGAGAGAGGRTEEVIREHGAGEGSAVA